MDEQEQITHFANDIDALIGRYKDEYDMTYASFIGVLQMSSHVLLKEALGEFREDKDDWKGSI